MTYEYFKLSEFDSPDEPGSGSNMDPTFLDALDEARDLAGVPFRISSGFRSKAHNAEVGGVPSSAHCQGFAADIACTGSRERLLIVRALISAGINRIGISTNFIHADASDTKSAEVLWLYP